MPFLAGCLFRVRPVFFAVFFESFLGVIDPSEICLTNSLICQRISPCSLGVYPLLMAIQVGVCPREIG